jgi:hypothetical protein
VNGQGQLDGQPICAVRVILLERGLYLVGKVEQRLVRRLRPQG